MVSLSVVEGDVRVGGGVVGERCLPLDVCNGRIDAGEVDDSALSRCPIENLLHCIDTTNFNEHLGWTEHLLRKYSNVFLKYSPSDLWWQSPVSPSSITKDSLVEFRTRIALLGNLERYPSRKFGLMYFKINS
ncbi:hypothetical protein CEXT_810071 [Caerostris extrusa]|uniref:Uncharacterized protein n=1 Tax=Caerostris extrusa TaxID=172846 RepID=A0AAV4U1P4_CAEEX|nr:hypothetical protein CEXT_810071 [Caerostris extrusa]